MITGEGKVRSSEGEIAGAEVFNMDKSASVSGAVLRMQDCQGITSSHI